MQRMAALHHRRQDTVRIGHESRTQHRFAKVAQGWDCGRRAIHPARIGPALKRAVAK